jgi:indolepyruvate ferredoxin oxidoreductase, beta subunit
MDRTPKAITVAILAMGGEGGGVLADWIVDLAENCGYLAQSTSVPGVAQRTGSTIYYIEIFPETSGEQPVLALMPVPGELDIVIGSELMEAARAVQRGLVTPDRTTLIASTHRVYSMTEKTAMGDGRIDREAMLDACRGASRVLIHADFAHIAEENRTMISAPLFGALAAAGALPFRREQFEDAIKRSGVGVESSLAAFRAGFSAGPPDDAVGGVSKARTGALLAPLAERISRDFPTSSHEILIAGIERLADYQDVAYASVYLDRLDAVRAVDQGALLRETGRYLALWMSYEDAIRVSDLKIRRERFERVRRETRADAAQLVQINEFLHPRIQEIADILPEGIGRWLLKAGFARKMIERFTRNGRILQTTSLRGFLQLYVLASLRPWRRKSLRFARETEKINQWLTQIAPLAREDYALALEVAECPRLLKGYGDTNILGNRNFTAVMGAVAKLRGAASAAPSLRKLREAALADDTGAKLSEALRETVA